jgi:hypothetical protein
MNSTQPRRDFLKGLIALPLLGAPPASVAAPVSQYDLAVFPVAGFAFYEGPKVLDRLQPGDPLALVAEPGNRHDPRAIRIEAGGRHIGYVPRSENGPIGRLLAQGVRLQARVMAVQPRAESWDAVRVAVSLRAPWAA